MQTRIPGGAAAPSHTPLWKFMWKLWKPCNQPLFQKPALLSGAALCLCGAYFIFSDLPKIIMGLAAQRRERPSDGTKFRPAALGLV